MPENKSLKLITTIFIFCLLNNNALAFYKPKLMVTEFENPQTWKNPFNPGKLLSNRIEKALIKETLFQDISYEQIGNSNPENMSESKIPYSMDFEPAIYYMNEGSTINAIPIQNSSGEKINQNDKKPGEPKRIPNNSIPWPSKLGKISEKPSLYLIKGQVVKFDYDAFDSSKEISEKVTKHHPQNAELEIKIQLIQNKTGRIIKKQNLRAFSSKGKSSFSPDIEHNQKPSSMDLAISILIKKIIATIKDSISSSALEGEIIAINNENVLINLGQQNGVKVGDKFRVYSFSLKLTDPLTENDLGDIYSKMGIIRIIEPMQGFSKALITTGKQILPGNLVKSFKKINDYNSRKIVPWWEFRDINSAPLKN